MGQAKKRFVAKGVPGGWKIWNNKSKKWWGQLYEKQPDELIEELNGLKRPKILTILHKKYINDKR